MKGGLIKEAREVKRMVEEQWRKNEKEGYIKRGKFLKWKT